MLKVRVKNIIQNLKEAYEEEFEESLDFEELLDILDNLLEDRKKNAILNIIGDMQPRSLILAKEIVNETLNPPKVAVNTKKRKR